MKTGSINFFLALLLASGLSGQALDERFHSPQEIQTLLDSLTQVPAYQDLIMVDTIGYSQHEQMPILAVKISDNVTVREDEPRVLFIGQVHAEEILGVEAVLTMIEEILDPAPSDALHMFVLRSELEIWFVPTYNPEGMEVVFSGQDLSYRKNKHDFSPEGPWANGIFDYDPSIGNDVDGVDMNRNYDFNWMFGESFLELDPSPYGAHYDYFKGLAPFSEPETRAIRDLALEQDFLFSIAFHSSRSGNLSEKVFYPWSWDNDKVTPDDDAVASIGEYIASILVDESGQGTYLPAYGGSRNGKAHDWFYVNSGCFQYLIECGTANLQPDSLLIEETVNRLIPSMIYLMDRTIGYYVEATQITGIVSDGSTGQPQADVEVKILELSGTVQEPRLTDEFGRFRRIVEPGTYTVVASKPGFYSDTTTVTANMSTVTNIAPVLTARPVYSINFEVSSLPAGNIADFSGLFISGNETIEQDMSAGSNYISLTENSWLTVLAAEGYLPWIDTLDVSSSGFLPISLVEPAVVWNPELSDTSFWNSIDGSWVFTADTLKSQLEWLYQNPDSGSQTSTLISKPIDVSGTNRLALSVNHRYELEWDVDSIFVSLVDRNGSRLGDLVLSDHSWSAPVIDWVAVNSRSGFDTVQVMLEFKIDGSVNYRGWEIFELKLQAGLDNYLAVFDEDRKSGSAAASISNPYPNPSTGMIGINLAGISGPVSITVYDLLGRQVASEKFHLNSAARHNWKYNFRRDGFYGSSGLYFMRIKTPQQTVVKKCIVLKN